MGDTTPRLVLEWTRDLALEETLQALEDAGLEVLADRDLRDHLRRRELARDIGLLVERQTEVGARALMRLQRYRRAHDPHA